MHSRFAPLFLALLALIEVFACQAMHKASNEANDEQVSQRLDLYIQALTRLKRFSGTVLVAKDDQLLLNKGYGFASYEFEVSNTPQTKFRICSITKMVTAVAIMQLQERGLLNVNNTLDNYFPDFPRGNEITIHQLLTHTSGISSSNPPLEMVVCPATLEQIYSFYKKEPLDFEPGSDYQYSNVGYYLLSHIIQKVSGKSYESFIKENILVPLSMNESFFREADYGILKKSAIGYCFSETNTIVNGHYVYDNFKGGGGLFCTAYDLYLFAKALIAGKLINEQSLQAMFSSYHSKENYGYGCTIHEVLGHKCVEHGGMLSSGFKSNLSIFAEDDIYIVILSNFFSSWINEARDALGAIMLQLPYEFLNSDPISIDSALCDDYIGTYDHPFYEKGYAIQRKLDALYLPDGKELSPTAEDQFMTLNCNSDNMIYKFIRNEQGQVDRLVIQGGAPFFKVVCQKVH